MKRKGVIIRALLILVVASLAFDFLTGKAFVQILLSTKYACYLLAGSIAIALLAMRKVPTPVRVTFLIAFFFVFGVAIEIHPSPLCAITKAAQRYQLNGFIPPPMMVMTAVMLFLTVAGNKIFCGWICPLGCLQEAVFLISKRLRKINPPFYVTNTVRSSILALFIVFLFSGGGNIYNFFNPFEVFHWHFSTSLIIVTSLVVIASLLFYRPFCQFICPAGLVTWVFEHLSLTAIRKHEKRCTNCRLCIKESPCNAIEDIVSNRKIVSDCFACGACIKACPEDALSFSLR